MLVLWGAPLRGSRGEAKGSEARSRLSSPLIIYQQSYIYLLGRKACWLKMIMDGGDDDSNDDYGLDWYEEALKNGYVSRAEVLPPLITPYSLTIQRSI